MNAIMKRNDVKPHDLSKLVPSTTMTKTIAPSSKRPPPDTPPSSERDDQTLNQDLEATSYLVDEAVRLLNNREAALKGKPIDIGKPAIETLHAPNAGPIYTPVVQTDNQDTIADDDYDQSSSMGKRFRESNMTARNYVRDFEHKVKQKKSLESNNYGKGRRSFKSKFLAHMRKGGNIPPVMEPDSWRHKASRSVRFSMKQPTDDQSSTNTNVGKAGTRAPEDDPMDSRWLMRHENDRNWWKWKLKQGFMQNDELLNRLTSQRQKLESAFNLVERNKFQRDTILGNKSGTVISPNSLTAMSPFVTRKSSQHVSVEVAPPVKLTGSNKLGGRPSVNSPGKTREPDLIPNFTPTSKFLINMIGANLIKENSTSATAINKQKLKTLKKDPYLAKLLTGGENFKPEMMLDIAQTSKRHELTQQFKQATAATNAARRKISLESLTDSTDDEFTAAKFFNPDVKVLYERMSEMGVNANPKNKSNFVNLNSREPSDGFLNLSLLLATGRFNRFNKLPNIKALNYPKHTAPAPKQNKKPDTYHRTRIQQNFANRKHSSRVQPKTKTAEVGVIAATYATKELPKPRTPMSPAKNIEDMTTKQWAKQLMSKMKSQSHAVNRVDSDDSFMTLSDDDDQEVVNRTNGNLEDIFKVHTSAITKKKPNKEPNNHYDHETNMLYHEILMSKWKKDKHGKKDKDPAGAAGHGAVSNGNKSPKLKWRIRTGTKKTPGAVDNNSNKKSDNNVVAMSKEKPRGLDIWLENIREKAKKERMTAPPAKGQSELVYNNNNNDKTKVSQPIITTFKKSAFNPTD